MIMWFGPIAVAFYAHKCNKKINYWAYSWSLLVNGY